MSVLHTALALESQIFSAEASCENPSCTSYEPCVTCELIQGAQDLAAHLLAEIVSERAPAEVSLS